MAEITQVKGVWTVKDSEGNLTELYPAGKEIDSVSGSQLVVEDSRAGALRINKTFGKSEQLKTTGAQLFDASKLATTSAGGATVTNNGDGSFTISGSGTMNDSMYFMYHTYSNEETLKILKAGSLMLKTNNVTTPYVYVSILDGDGNGLREANSRISTLSHIDITGDLLLTDGIQLKIGFYGQSGSTITPGTIKPMLYFDGDSDGTWEPYTGNMPAPNPQYPQPIVNAGQKLAEGWQLLNFSDINEGTSANVTWSCKNGVVTAKGTASGTSSTLSINLRCEIPIVKGTYRLGATGTDILKLVAQITKSDGTVDYKVSGISSTSMTLDGTETECLVYCQVNNGNTVDATVYPMLNVGTTAKPWEPYTGGVKTVYDFGIETEVLGKNLCDGISQGFYVSGSKAACGITSSDNGIAIPVTDGEYTISTKVSQEKYRCCCVNELPTHAGAHDCYNWSVKDSQSISITVDCTGYKYLIVNATDLTAIQIERGEIATDYEPYKPKQSLPINTPNGLPGIEVTDASLANHIDADGKMWVCDTREWERGVDVQRVLRKEYNGTEGWALAERNEADGINGVFYIGQQPTIKDNAVALCSHYIWGQNASTNPDIFDTYHRQIRFNAISTTYTVDDWKAQLAEWAANGTPLRTITQLVTPIETPIPEEEMAAWRAMHSNEPTTTILSDADVEVEYPTSRVGAVALDADMRSRELEKSAGSAVFIGDITTETEVSFNDLVETGVYDFDETYISNAENAPYPYEMGSLSVKKNMSTGYVSQMYQTKSGQVYVRFSEGVIEEYGNSYRTWTDWSRLALSSDVTDTRVPYVEIGVSGQTTVYASLGLIRLSDTYGNIIINYKITENKGSSDVYSFIDMSKVKNALDVNALNFNPTYTAVILQPAISHDGVGTLTETTAYANENDRGLTGLLFNKTGALGRIYTTGGGYGEWPLSSNLYKTGTYGTIIINGATLKATVM